MKTKIPNNAHKEILRNPSFAKNSSIGLRTSATTNSLRVLSIEDWNFWLHNGFVVIKNVVSREQVKKTADFLWEFEEKDPNNQESWYTAPRAEMQMKELQGTGMVEVYNRALAGFPTRVALEGGVEGITKDYHQWVEGEQLEKIYEKYDHPLYKRLNEQSKDSGHGGMDGIMMYRIVECLQKGLPLDQNVYEGALWSAVTELSGKSIEQDGAPQQFPDFTRGNWKNTAPLGIIS